MPNTYFQFKQFVIHQDRCAMKVCTDACVLGAWFAAKVPDYSNVLDIGSGTGLLMMMLAQRSQANINGIEIDLASFKQLKENISQNKWKERLKVFPGDARSYAFPEKYDFIISNPPFFENDLLSTDQREQVAKHSQAMNLQELIQVLDNNLAVHGSFGILLPYHRWEYFDKLANRHHFFLREKLLIKQSPKHHYFRAILHYARHRESFSPSYDLLIQEHDGAYSPAFVDLMKEYYLNL